MRDYKVAWGVTSWAGHYLQECVASLPPGEEFEILDNKSLRWPLAKTWNHFAAKYLIDQDFDCLMVANDDVVVRPDTGQLMAWGLLEAQFDPSQPTISATGPDGKLLLATCYVTNEEEGGGGNHEDVGCRWGVGAPDYSCFAITRKYLDVVGWFDEMFDPAFFEDNDSHYRIRLAGYEAAQWAPYFHHRGSTIKHDSERREFIIGKAFENCRKYYAQKWGGDPGHERFTKPFNIGAGFVQPQQERVVVGW